MSGTRQPAFAGRFYPAGREDCLRMLDAMIEAVELDRQPIGAVVPHAGWIYSGPTAALGFSAVKHAVPETVVLFGAVHVLDANNATVYADEAWETPLGRVEVDIELAEHIGKQRHIVVDSRPHRNEHSIEVQLPLIQQILGDVKVLPISVRPGPLAPEIGRSVARAVAELGRRVVFVASTDLTHYGPVFGFEPHGHGVEGVQWAKDVNDRRFVKLLEELNAEAVVPEAATNHNSCGSGAVAAVIAACREAGADEYTELRHSTSADRELLAGGFPVNSVGYEAGVFTTGH